MAGRLLQAAPSVGPSAPRPRGRVAWADTFGGHLRRPVGCLRLAAPGWLRSTRLPLLPRLCLSPSRPQVPPSLPASPRPPWARPAVHGPFPSLPGGRPAVPSFSLSLLPGRPTGAYSLPSPGPAPRSLVPHPRRGSYGQGPLQGPCCCSWDRGWRWRVGRGDFFFKLKYNSPTVKITHFSAQFCQF